jgi:hypothetical protein
LAYPTCVLAQTGLIANFEMGDRFLLGELVLWASSPKCGISLSA